jgi:hypothetical protein
MKRILNKQEIDYVIFHLKLHVGLPESYPEDLVLLPQGATTDTYKQKIIFRLSDKPFALTDVTWLSDIPVLFPLKGTTFFTIDDAQNLVFDHDILKSAFYLLSGYQEYENKNSADQLGRFSFEDSVQKKLGIIDKPTVNYYFNIITQGLKIYYQQRGIHLKERRLFQNFGFLLSHDIDYVDQYSWDYFGYKLKELAHLVKSRNSVSTTVKLLIKGLADRLHGVNPYWNFDFLRDLERKHNFVSTFYFLDQGVKRSDASYSFEEPRLRELFKYLSSENCEIGIHGPVRSVDDRSVLKNSIEKLERAAGISIAGIRQHRLLWKHPGTAIVQESAGLVYDTTLGFAAHEGFRNSYCYPFRLFDFSANRMLDLWEIPLNVMDVTLFSYMNYRPQEAMTEVNNLISQVKEFGGCFNLLWHNSFFDDTSFPGVTQFYMDLLQNISADRAENMVASKLIEKLTSYSAAYE